MVRGNAHPVVSIIIPAYNAARFIGRALRSAVEQTYTNMEIAVVDDGSNDATAAIVRGIGDSRVRYIYQDNGGQGKARNHGIRRSRGEYITFLDADDYYLPTKVERQVLFLMANRHYKVVYCNVVHFFARNPRVLFRRKMAYHGGNILPDLLKTSFINPNTVMVEREVLEKVGLFNETRYYPEDWEMWLKIALAGCEFGYVDEDLVVVEVRSDSNTTMEIQPLLKKNAVEMFECLFGEGVEVKTEAYDAAKSIKALKWKMALAHLMNGQRKEFLRSFVVSSDLKLLAAAAGLALTMVPARFIRSLWRLNQFWQAERVPSVDFGEGMKRPAGNPVGTARGTR